MEIKHWIFALLITLSFTDTCSSETLSETSNDVFVAAEVIKKAKPYFGFIEQENVSERDKKQNGYVELTFMVNPSGVPEEVSVSYSSHVKFERPAIEALAHYEYKPATLNGEPIASSARETIIFDYFSGLQGVNQGVRSFSTGYTVAEKQYELVPNFLEFSKTFNELIEEPVVDKARLKRLLEAMGRNQRLSFFALVTLGMNKIRYYNLMEMVPEKTEALRDTLFYDSQITRDRFKLDLDLVNTLQANLLTNLIETNQLQEALIYFQELGISNPSLAAEFEAYMDRVLAIRTESKSFAREIRLDEDGAEFVELFLRNFELAVDQGSVEKLKLRCERKFAELKFSAEASYSIPESWGQCQLEIVGDPQSLGKIYQG